MPRVSYSRIAVLDLARLHTFLQSKDPDTANRAIAVIRKAIQTIKVQPDRFRPVPEKSTTEKSLLTLAQVGIQHGFIKNQTMKSSSSPSSTS
jgi:ParE toxin of type II toxin-antitoxin system, parDE